MPPCARIVVAGRVQGVGFRWFAQAEARQLGLSGWVRNRRDGTVEAEVHGERALVERLVERLRSGPSSAFVRDVSVGWEPEPAAPPTGFDIHPTV
jgi:acylphosphatase